MNVIRLLRPMRLVAAAVVGLAVLMPAGTASAKSDGLGAARARGRRPITASTRPCTRTMHC
jgi:hypothetical protein